MRFVVFLWLWVSACSSTPGLKADPAKLGPWPLNLEGAQPLPPPYVASYTKGNQSLTFLSVEHETEIQGENLRFLQSALNSPGLKAFVLEGIPRAAGTNPASFVATAEKEGKLAQGYFPGGERTLSILAAKKRDIPFVGVEPSADEMRRAVTAAGFQAEDLFYYYALLSVPEWRSDRTLTRQTLEVSFHDDRAELAARAGLGARKPPSFADFTEWYAAKNGQPFRPFEVKSETVQPNPAGALFTQRLAAAVERARSESILAAIAEALARYGNVAVVMSPPQFPVQRGAIEALLGPPTRISDEP